MGNTNGGKFPRVLYNLNLIRSKSGEKHKKAIEMIKAKVAVANALGQVGFKAHIKKEKATGLVPTQVTK